MVLHGVTQLFANGFRAFLLRERIFAPGLVWYGVGSLASLAFFAWLALVVARPTVFVFMGGIPLALSLLPNRWMPRFERPGAALACGAVCTGASLLSGVSGPLLDVFFVRAELDRFEVIATKAFTQVVGHVLKIVYFAWLVRGPSLEMNVPWWLYPVLVACAWAARARAGGSSSGSPTRTSGAGRAGSWWRCRSSTCGRGYPSWGSCPRGSLARVTTAESARVPAASEVAPPRAPEPARLSWSAIFDYVAPTFGLGFMLLMIAIYLMKFATDVLGMSAAVDGHDHHARADLGRLRRSGRRLSLGPHQDAHGPAPALAARVDRAARRHVRAALGAAARREPGASCSAGWRSMVVLFYTASTVILIPHTALGAELTDSYHDRTRIFGARFALWTVGSFAAIAGFFALEKSDRSAHDRDRRSRSARRRRDGALLTLWTVVRACASAREFQGRGARNPYGAFLDVWRNPHARLLLLVYGIESLGAGDDRGADASTSRSTC